MKLVNLTPHPINVIGENGMSITIKPSGKVARVIQETVEDTIDVALTPSISVTLKVKNVENVRVIELPPPEDGTIYIVSTLVAQTVPRHDVIAPLSDHTAERDNMDNIVGVRGFRRFTVFENQNSKQHELTKQ